LIEEDWMTKIHFIGAPDLVGRAAFLIEEERHQVVVDYGVELTRPPKFPLSIPPRYIDGVILSHAHLDHVGAAPYLYVSGNMPLYLTKPTLDLTEILVRDFIKLSGEYIPYEYIDFIYMSQRAYFLGYREVVQVPNSPFKVEFLDAGHIPGSSQVIIRVDNKHKILYTSDLNNYETRLQPPADINYDEEFDVVIVESTYGDEVHPERSRLEKLFIEKVSDVVENGGIALVPAFAVGRSQEILLILRQRGFKHRIVMDGMAIDVTEILLNNRDYLKSPRSLKKAFGKIKKVRRWRDRKKVIKEPGVIIAPAGMLGGGSAVYYISKLYRDPRNAIFLVGYQAPGTPGRVLLEEGVVMVENVSAKAEAKRYYFEFSSHTDSNGLRELLKSLSGDPLIVIVHGEEDGRMGLKNIAEEMGFKTYLPTSGETYVLY
jgi:putative mRNA 3-end processing factor